MPIYEWVCPRCGHEEETLQSMNAPAPVCLKCAYEFKNKNILEVMQRKISKSSFTLKGDGWFKDGYSKPLKGKDKTPKKPAAGEKK